MATEAPTKGLQLRSIIKASGELELTLAEVAIAPPAGDDVVVRVEAAPLNPSDLGLLLGAADLSTAKAGGTAEQPTLTAQVPQGLMRAMAARVDQSMPVGNEGAGTVVAAGPDPAAQALLGKTVTLFGGAMYAQYRVAKAGDVMVLPAGATAAEGASCFVNPLTALGMVETMKLDGHVALVHTAAASNLGQMLQKICLKDGIDLVNIVRSPEQAKILTDIGAKFVADSSSPNFEEELVMMLTASDATLAFDAIGGGKLASQILAAMERAQSAKAGGAFNRYGSTRHKQLYIYGGLDTRPTELVRSYGMYWSLGGWILTGFLARIGADGAQRLRQRVMDELKTTFASHYTAEITLQQALQPDMIARYNAKTTGEKYLVTPAKS